MGISSAVCPFTAADLLASKDGIIITGKELNLERTVCAACRQPVGTHNNNKTGCCLTQDDLSEHRELMISVARNTDGTTRFACSSCWEPFLSHQRTQVEGRELQ